MYDVSFVGMLLFGWSNIALQGYFILFYVILFYLIFCQPQVGKISFCNKILDLFRLSAFWQSSGEEYEYVSLNEHYSLQDRRHWWVGLDFGWFGSWLVKTLVCMPVSHVTLIMAFRLLLNMQVSGQIMWWITSIGELLSRPTSLWSVYF